MNISRGASLGDYAVFFTVFLFFIDGVFWVSMNELLLAIYRYGYSYILDILLIMAVYVAIGSRGIQLAPSIEVGRLLVGASLISMSFTTHLLSYRINLFVPQIRILSIVLLVWGILSMMLDRESLGRLMPIMLTLILMVPPLPSLSHIIPRYTGYIVSGLFKGELAWDPVNGVVYKVVGPTGSYVDIYLSALLGEYVIVATSIALLIMASHYSIQFGELRPIIFLNTLFLLGAMVVIVYIIGLVRVLLTILLATTATSSFIFGLFHPVLQVATSLLMIFSALIISRRIFGVECSSYSSGRVLDGGVTIASVLILALALWVGMVLSYGLSIETALQIWINISLVLAIATTLYLIISILIKYMGVSAGSSR